MIRPRAITPSFPKRGKAVSEENYGSQDTDWKRQAVPGLPVVSCPDRLGYGLMFS